MRTMKLLFAVSTGALAIAAMPASGQVTEAQKQPPESQGPTKPQAGTGGTSSAEPVPDAAAPAANADGSAADSGTITVTGSRIRRPNLESFEPIVTVDDRYIQERNLTNIADALNELPGFRGSITPAGAQGSFGQGVNFVNNFGLGSNRTLTLVNGRRFVSSNVPTLFNQGSAGTQVDLNVIPAILTDRIDTVSIGGAPVYGSDAISGTVNVILKTRFNGLQASVLTGITERGDNFRYNVAVAGGLNFADDRGNISLSYSRDRTAGVLFNSRDFLSANLGNATNPSTAQLATLGRPAGVTAANDGRVNTTFGFNDSSSDGNPGTILVRDRSIPLLTRGGLITLGRTATGASVAAAQRLQFDRSGSLIPFNPGIRFLGATEASGGDGFRFNDFAQITSDLERDIFNGFLNFEFSEAATFFAEATYFRSRGDELVQQPSFNSSLFGGLGGQLTFDVTSPFLTPQARTQLTALGVTNFQVSRASADLADLTGFSQNHLYRGVVGIKGNVPFIGDDDWNYEISANYGRTDISDFGQDINAQNFINAVNVTTNAQGQIVCTATPTRQAAPGGTPVADPNCVPLNLLGEGLSDPRARAYVIADVVTKSRLEQLVFNANAGGTLFKLLGNSVGINFGLEHREERASFTPSTFQQQGLGRTVAIAPVSGKYKVDEVFGEALVPLVTQLNELPFLNRLEVFGRARYVNNSINGRFLSWSAGGTIAPIHDIQFRGNFTRSFRAPAITELFLPASNSFVTVPDLCSAANRNAGPDPATRLRNCNAFLGAFPNATPLDAASATVPGRSGGNAALQNEVANSFTYGVIIQPSFIRGLTLTADYLRIKIDNPISNLSVATIASACFDNPVFNLSDPANGNAFCSQIPRFLSGAGGAAANGGNIAGQVINNPATPVRSGFVNGKSIYFSGIQGSVNYTSKLEGIGLPGSVEVGSDIFFVRRRLNDITGVAPVRTDGIFGDPKFSAQANVRYIHPDFGVSTSVNYVGRQIATRTGLSLDLREFNALRPYATVNSSIYINASKNLRLTLSATNLFDRIGENYQGVIAPITFTDLLGRRFAFSARVLY